MTEAVEISSGVESLELIKITNGNLKGLTINGIFEFIDYNVTPYGLEVAIILDGRRQVVEIPKGFGSVEQVSVGKSIPVVTEFSDKLSEDEVAKIIDERFSMLTVLVNTLLSSDAFNTLVVTSIAGTGKTTTVEDELTRLERERGQYWSTIGGSISDFGVYESLYNSRYKGSVVVFDDINVFSSEIKLNCLKKALDTRDNRVVDWRSATHLLESRGIPPSFKFEGKVIFLTNTKILDPNSRSALNVHLQALANRGPFLDLGIHDIKTMMIHVKTQVRKKNSLVRLGLTPEQQETIIEWLEDNKHRLMSLSLRTPLIIGEYMKTTPDLWETLARHTLLVHNNLVC